MRRHPGRAVLRRIQDEPEAVAERDRLHAASCARCAGRSEVLATNAAMAARALSTGDTGMDPLPALRRLRQQEPAVVAPKPGARERLRAAAWLGLGRQRAVRAGAVGTTVALILATLVATGAAGSLIKIFEPESFVAVPFDLTSLGSLPDLGGFGSTHVLQEPSVTTTTSLAQAAAASGLPLKQTGPLPASIKGQPTYVAIGPGSASFTFDAQVASGTATKLGRTLPALPARLDGAVLTLRGGPLVVEVVGSQPDLGSRPGGSRRGPTDGGPEGHKPGLLSELGGIPQLMVVQMKAPVLYSDTLTVAQYEGALVSMPGVPPTLAAQIRSLGDLSSTLPIPIPTSLASSHAVDINGAPGLVIGDTTRIASGVIWQSHGLVYAVIGALSDHQVVAIARAMH